MEKLRAIPGVQSVAAVNMLPLTGFSNFPAQREGHVENSTGVWKSAPLRRRTSTSWAFPCGEAAPFTTRTPNHRRR